MILKNLSCRPVCCESFCLDYSSHCDSFPRSSRLPLAKSACVAQVPIMSIRVATTSALEEHPFDKSEKLGRPLSPHVTIYRWACCLFTCRLLTRVSVYLLFVDLQDCLLVCLSTFGLFPRVCLLVCLFTFMFVYWYVCQCTF